VRGWRAGTFAVAALACALALGAAPEASLAQAKKKSDAPAGPAIDPLTGKRINEALEHLNAKRHAQAKAVLGKINLERLSPYERSRVEQILASIEHAQENLPAARSHLEQALAAGGLNDQEQSQVRFQIAQLFMAEERWKEGAAALQAWFATAENPNSAAYYLLAVAYYQQGDHKAALAPAQKAVEMSEKPQESWLQLLLALRLEREEHRAAVPLLRRLLTLAPEKKTYWIQLSAVNGAIGSYEDALAPLQVAYNAGMLTEDSEIRRLADLLMYLDIPYRAAEILTQSLEAQRVTGDGKLHEKLGNCWVAAREYEKAIAPLRRAADLSDTGDLYVRLGEVQVQREDWGGAEDALRRGLEKGRLKDPGNAQLLMGIASYSQKKPKEARSWFERARAHGKTRTQAEGWIHHIDRELEISS
jgi:tetratricopeptide (TPR) repeat protein